MGFRRTPSFPLPIFIALRVSFVIGHLSFVLRRSLIADKQSALLMDFFMEKYRSPSITRRIQLLLYSDRHWTDERVWSQN